MPGEPRRLLFVVLLINIGLYAPIEVAYLSGKGLSVLEVSLLNLSIPFLCALLEVPMGLLGDLVGRKWTLVLCTVTFLLGPVLLIAGESLPVFALAYLVEAIGWSLYSGNTDAMVVESARDDPAVINRRLAAFYASFTLGAVVGGVLNTTLLLWQNENLNNVLVLLIVFRLSSLATALAVPNTWARPTSRPTAILRQAVAITRERFSVLIILYEASGRLSFYLPVIAQLLLLRAGLSVAAFGVLSSALLAVQYLAQRRNDRIVDRFGRRTVLHGATATMVAGLLFLALPGVVPVVVGCLLVQIAGPLRFQCLSLLKNEAVGNTSRATYLSCISLCVMLVNSLFLAVIAWLFAMDAAIGVLTLAGVVAAASALVRPLVAHQGRFVERRTDEVAN